MAKIVFEVEVDVSRRQPSDDEIESLRMGLQESIGSPGCIKYFWDDALSGSDLPESFRVKGVRVRMPATPAQE